MRGALAVLLQPCLCGRRNAVERGVQFSRQFFIKLRAAFAVKGRLPAEKRPLGHIGVFGRGIPRRILRLCLYAFFRCGITRIARRREKARLFGRAFRRLFLLRAAGRSPEEMLAELTRRLGNDDEAEAAEALDQLRQIALLRLEGTIA